MTQTDAGSGPALRDWLKACQQALDSGADPVWLIAHIHISSEEMLEQAVRAGLVVVLDKEMAES